MAAVRTMTWEEARAAALLLAEETVGRRGREAQASEDAAMASSIRAIQQHQR